MTAVSDDDAGRRYTERLRLEPIDVALAADLWSLHQDPDVAAWSGGPWSRDHADALAASFARSWRRNGVGKWLAYDRADGTLVGRGGPSVTADLGGRDVEIGWAVRRALWGRGYATEIGRAAVALADEVLGVGEVVAYTEIHNVRSRAVMERLGMTYRGEHRGPGLAEGVDGIVGDAPFAVYVLPRPPWSPRST